MNIDQAIALAKKQAREHEIFVGVVAEDGGYDTATEWELETFYAGAEAIYMFGPDGEEA